MINYKTEKNLSVAVFGGGCFWCTEAVFKSLKGVTSVLPGYSGGSKEDSTYEKVSGGNTGHAEAIKIEYNSEKISYNDLLDVFFKTHNPTTLNRQGNDVGKQYRSVIFYTTPEQKDKAEKLVTKLSEVYENSVVTEIKPLKNFFVAEDYHKNYFKTHKDNPYCEVVIAPKLEKLQNKFKNLLKNNKQ